MEKYNFFLQHLNDYSIKVKVKIIVVSGKSFQDCKNFVKNFAIRQ